MCNLMYQTVVRRNHNQEFDADMEAFKASKESNIWLVGGGVMFSDLTVPKSLSQVHVSVGSYERMRSVDLALYTNSGTTFAFLI